MAARTHKAEDRTSNASDEGTATVHARGVVRAPDDEDYGETIDAQDRDPQASHARSAAMTRHAGRRSAAGAVMRPRAQTAADGVRDIAARLFARHDPTAPLSVPTALRPHVQHYYDPDVLRPIDWYVKDVFDHGAQLFLQGKCSGVGSTMLACDFARAFNYRAGLNGDGRRVLYARFEPGTDTVPKFYDTLGLCFRAPLTSTEVRFRSSLHFALRVLTGAALQGATAIILDHLRETPPKVRAGVATLLQLTDPNYIVPTEIGAFAEEARGRIGVMIVDRVAPQRLFRDNPSVLLLLENRHQVLRPYQTVGEIAEAMRQAGIGLDDLDVAVPDDRDMARMVLQKTGGLPAQMTPLFELIDTVARANGARRPSAALVAQALPFYRNLVEVVSAPVDPSDTAGERLYGVYAADTPELPAALSTEQRRRLLHADVPVRSQETEDKSASTSAGRRPAAAAARARQLRERREQRQVAKAEGQAMTRKSHVNVDYGDSN